MWRCAVANEERSTYLLRWLEIVSVAYKHPNNNKMHTGFWIEASVEIVKIESSSRHQKYETDCSVQRQKQEQDHICKEQKSRTDFRTSQNCKCSVWRSRYTKVPLDYELVRKSWEINLHLLQSSLIINLRRDFARGCFDVAQHGLCANISFTFQPTSNPST